ncbi:MAG: SdiA-regulated domain-containing protein [Saprospiraceae bacterium]|nr:SdiA-regulated domain-containing protein [Saprospiraceae bacterium]
MSKQIIFTSLIGALIACGPQTTTTPPPPIQLNLVSFADVPVDYDLGYDLTDPDGTFKLPKKLEEVSGLSISRDGATLIAIEDENGKIYCIDKQTGELEDDFTFWKPGDYEGVEVVGNDIYVLKSSGTLYRVQKAGTKDQEVEKYNGFLDTENDVEGLTYDPIKHRLLLACKGKAGKGEPFRAKKSIYAFDLQTLSLQANPVFVISLDDIHNYLSTAPAIRKLSKLAEMFKPGTELTFAPSGVAIHPLTGDIFVLSSVGKVLMVISQEGKLLHIEKMRKEVHTQPEGLCFDQDGTLYIANEGKGARGRILRFDYHRQ